MILEASRTTPNGTTLTLTMDIGTPEHLAGVREAVATMVRVFTWVRGVAVQEGG